jgi:small conductance mechanosensitive channel
LYVISDKIYWENGNQPTASCGKLVDELTKPNSKKSSGGHAMSTEVTQFINTYLIPLGWRLIGAIVAWIIGGWIASLLVKALNKAMKRRRIDTTLAKYAEGAANVALRILLIIVIFGILGIETTSFAALLAAAGIAIGAAWAGLLAHFAAGVFLVFLRPFKVGDAITVGGATGTVMEIGMFSTVINTPDNVRVYIGNNTVFSGNIQNYSTNAYRRVDLTAQIAHETVPSDAIQRLEEKLKNVPNVLAEPKPQVEILSFNEYGTLLAVRPFCANDHYAQVYFDVNKAIVEVGTEGGYKAPARRMATRNLQ